MVTLTKEREHLLGLAYSSEVYSIVLMAGSRWRSSRHGTGEGAESSTSGSAGSRKRELTLGLS